MLWGGKLHPTLLDILHPVGEYYETSNTSFDPNVTWGGTWVRETDERVLVAAGSTIAVGATGGEKTHKMTEDELVSHGHFGLRWGDGSEGPVTLNGGSSPGYNLSYSGRNDGSDNLNVRRTGGSKPFNIMQPYKGVVRWHRTA